MKYLRVVPIMMFLCVTLAGQDKQYLSQEESDPEARRILDDMEEYLSGLDHIEAAFSMEVHWPGEEPVLYEGELNQQGKMFHIDVGEYEVMSDGNTRWVYLTEDNEVNIYNIENTGPQTPLDYLRLYSTEDFVYRLAGSGTEDGKSVDYIELKPLDSYSDYSKIRLTADAGDNKPLRLEVFEKSGSRTDFRLLSIRERDRMPEARFTFDTASHPGVRVEDLRID